RRSRSGDPFEVTAELTMSDADAIVGTIPYMAPEQIRGEAVDARSDLFALGIILYELATGKRPFTGDTPSDVSASILRDTPASLGDLRPDLPDALEGVVASCREKARRNRASSAIDICSDLRALHHAVERGLPEPLAHARPAIGNVASVAVLPFVNRSASVDDEYFSDGL